MKIPSSIVALLATATVAALCIDRALPQAISTERKVFSNSIVPLPLRTSFSAQSLQPEDLTNLLEFSISFKMRNPTNLQGSISRGEVVSPQVMERDYLPLPADYVALQKWLRENNLEITRTSSNRLSIYARGTLQQIQRSLGVQFAPITVDGIAYPAAKTPPSLPASLGQAVVGINGLQPYLKAHRRTVRMRPNIANRPAYLVNEVLKAYDANDIGVTGAGQTIAILIDTFPNDSDLISFWQYNHLSLSTNSVERINVSGQTLPPLEGEETLDVEWSSGIAPGARIRVYAAGSLEFVALDKALDRIIEDVSTHPRLYQLSISLGLGETYLPSDEVASESAKFATLAAQGVSVFVSSGDAGSNPDESGHSTTGPTQVEYASSDPNVTAVGGTSLILDVTSGQCSSEIAWTDSGGGVSMFFDRPVWQKGSGISPTENGNKRLVPDVSLVANPNTGALVIFQGTPLQYGGTSLSAPVWAGFCALINEARARKSKPPLGLLNVHLYPLIATKNFRDITMGNNGAFSAGVDYDMVTGIGSPDVRVLLQSLR